MPKAEFVRESYAKHQTEILNLDFSDGAQAASAINRSVLNCYRLLTPSEQEYIQMYLTVGCSIKPMGRSKIFSTRTWMPMLRLWW